MRIHGRDSDVRKSAVAPRAAASRRRRSTPDAARTGTVRGGTSMRTVRVSGSATPGPGEAGGGGDIEARQFGLGRSHLQRTRAVDRSLGEGGLVHRSFSEGRAVHRSFGEGGRGRRRFSNRDHFLFFVDHLENRFLERRDHRLVHRSFSAGGLFNERRLLLDWRRSHWLGDRLRNDCFRLPVSATGCSTSRLDVTGSVIKRFDDRRWCDRLGCWFRRERGDNVCR